VIKVERPGSGDFARAYDERVRGLASHFVWTNRSKESLTLDVKHAEAPGILAGRLLDGPTCWCRTWRPAPPRAWPVVRGAARKHPRLIVCDISGYGSDGPYRDKKAYDLLIQSESGFLSVTGTPDAPAKAGCSIADIAAGMYAYSHILAALLQRGRSGCGCHIEVSMLESMVEWMSYPLYYAFDGAAAAARRCRARDDLSLWPVPGRRRQDGDARPAERTRVAGVLHPGARTSRSCGRSTLRLERLAHGRPRRTATADRRLLRGPEFGTTDRQAGRRADCQRTHERHARCLATSAAGGTPAVDQVADTGRPDSGPAASRRGRCLHAADGCGAGSGRTQRRHPRRTGLGQPRIPLFPRKGFRWVLQMRGRRSGWQLFVARSQTFAVAVLPFDKMGWLEETCRAV
jgi:hypothetical protein